jgi:undecaprenyl-phosphate 4-deoxy-4-formamido-L-arabinose transferase
MGNRLRGNNSMKELSVVIPVYNSQDCIYELHRQIKDALNDLSYEVIFVNDQSIDESWDRIVNIARNDRNFIGLNLRKNCGQDNAIMAGLKESSGRYVVIMDDDLQHSPYDIKRLYEGIRAGDHDVCFANFRKKKHAFWKNAGSWLSGKVAEILLAKPRDIYLSPFKIIKKEIVDEIVRYDGPYAYVDGLILSVTNNITQVKLEHYKRFSGRSNYNLFRSMVVFLRLATNFSVIPLRVASFMGFMTAITGFVLVCVYIAEYFISDYVPEGWTSLIVINLLLGGLILISLGIIGEYLGRTYIKINRRPQYVIKEKIKNGEVI